MILWTMQPIEIYNLIQETGVYRCDPELCSILLPYFKKSYDWLSDRMTEKIGPPPEGVKYPVWAWYKQKGKHCKPDLRSERWCYGDGNEEYTCIEIEVPDDKVVLSDFDTWHAILGNSMISDTEEEDNAQEAYYYSLPEEQREKYKRTNWERVFDISPDKPCWFSQKDWIQATFWELKKEYIQSVRFFRTACKKDRAKALTSSMEVQNVF